MKNIQILLIEDDKSFQRLVELRLRSFLDTAEFHVANTLNQAREIIKRSGRKFFDLVMLDQHLPDGRGLLLLQEGLLDGTAVLAVSNDDDPEIPGETLKAGAGYFLAKTRVTEPLFRPLVLALIERNQLVGQIEALRAEAVALDAVRTLVGTLKHEINNPLGAVLGAAFILKSGSVNDQDREQAARLVEESGKRIKHVLDQLSTTISLESVKKSDQNLFQIPGDKPWDI